MKVIFHYILGALVVIATLATLGFALFSQWLNIEYLKPGPLKEGVLITVPKGAHIGALSDVLVYKNVIESKDLFLFLGKLSRKAYSLKAGEYEFSPGASIKDVLKKIAHGNIYNRKITIREGLTNYEIDMLLLQEQDLKKELINFLPEGSYLPETYHYAMGETNVDIFRRMAKAMKEAIDHEWERRVDGLPLKNKHEALTLASIIEKETSVPSERRKVAGVFINRLNRGMALQTDPTVIYAITKGKHKNNGKGPLGRRLLRKDLKYDSPYNTYLYVGLPPGPIANPGRASITAALNPEKHDYIYFVADGKGGHVFAKTLKEHNRNVAKWRKIRKGL